MSAGYRALLERLGDDAPTIALGEVAPHDVSGADTIKGAGRFVRYEGVEAAEATFRITCGGRTTRGAVSTWLLPASGIVTCDERPGGAMAEEARALGCRHTS